VPDEIGDVPMIPPELDAESELVGNGGTIELVGLDRTEPEDTPEE
jgi:hypothetical protein